MHTAYCNSSHYASLWWGIIESSMSTPQGALPELISPYMRSLIEKTGGANGPLGRQFMIPSEKTQVAPGLENTDPQAEAKYEVAPGLIYKYQGKKDENGQVLYPGRALWTISRFCATYCRFCFRGRMVGLPHGLSGESKETLARKPYLSDADIEKVKIFLTTHPEINEVILSGGDPLITSKIYFEKIILILSVLQKSGQLDFIRIHTRAPITNPDSLQTSHIEILKSVHMPHIVLHINHPLELTDAVKEKVLQLQKETGALLFSQTVLLRGVNDAPETLRSLFIECAKFGIRPYYLHYTDPVPWAQEFVVPFDRALEIWQALRPTLSGIVDTVKFVVDTPGGVGKIVVPDSYWSSDMAYYTDFTNTRQTRPA